MMKKLLTGFAGAFCAGALCASSPLSLDSDTTIDVPIGNTVTYSTLSGGAKPASGTRVKLVSFNSVEGSASIKFEGCRAQAVLANDGLYVEFVSGMSVNFY